MIGNARISFYQHLVRVVSIIVRTFRVVWSLHLKKRLEVIRNET